MTASVISSAPPVVKTIDGVTHETRPTPTEPHGAQRLELPDQNSKIHLTEVRRLAHEGLEAASRQRELGEKNIDVPQRPLPDPTQKQIGTS